MHNTWVRQDIVKVNLQWTALTGSEVENLISLMQGKEFTLTYREFGMDKTAEVYVAEVNYTKEYDGLYDSEGGLCTNITAAAVEK